MAKVGEACVRVVKSGDGHAMAETHPDPHAYPALYQLRTQMERRGYTCTLTEQALTVVAPVDHGPRLADVITCRARTDDGGRG